MDATDIATNLRRVQARIEAAARRAARAPGEILLVAVTKTQPLAAVQAAYRAGVRHFGENRVEEGAPKMAAFNAWLAAACEAPSAGESPTWHMIGHVQHRKAAEAMRFDVIHSLDSLRLADRLERLAAPEDPPVPVLLECNVSGEASKYGFALGDWQSRRQVRLEFFDTVRAIGLLPHLDLQGLMTMAPIVAEPEQTRPVFAALRALRDALREEFPTRPWTQLSMGMTDDFEVAVEEGATMVRVGRAIFGEYG
jgi:pyridoxal phosphate enzyme (YggS family)